MVAKSAAKKAAAPPAAKAGKSASAAKGKTAPDAKAQAKAKAAKAAPATKSAGKAQPAPAAKSAGKAQPAQAAPTGKAGKSAAAKAGGAGNDALINAFAELALYETKAGDGFKGGAYRKVAAALQSYGKPVTSGASVASLPGIGAASIAKIDEFLATRAIERLAKVKEQVGELPASVVAAAMQSASAAKSGAAGKKAGKKGTQGGNGLSADVMKKVAAARTAHEGKSLDQLKALLKLNNQSYSAPKSELLDRISHQAVLGAVPRCPVCAGGRPKFDIKTGKFKCSGFYDDDKPVPCAMEFDSLERLPWVTS
jgi:hypothetical protein